MFVKVACVWEVYTVQSSHNDRKDELQKSKSSAHSKTGWSAFMPVLIRHSRVWITAFYSHKLVIELTTNYFKTNWNYEEPRIYENEIYYDVWAPQFCCLMDKLTCYKSRSKLHCHCKCDKDTDAYYRGFVLMLTIEDFLYELSSWNKGREIYRRLRACKWGKKLRCRRESDAES